MDNDNFFMNRIILHVKKNQRYIIKCYSISMNLLDIFAHRTKISSRLSTKLSMSLSQSCPGLNLVKLTYINNHITNLILHINLDSTNPKHQLLYMQIADNNRNNRTNTNT
jgi:hypothetical protein